MRESDFARVFRENDPARSSLNTPLSSRAESDLREITSSGLASSDPRRIRGSTLGWLGVPVFAAAALALLIVLQTINPFAGPSAPAQAATPPLLQATGERIPFGEAMENAIAQLHQAPDGEVARRSQSEAWFVNTDFEGSDASFSYVSPQTISLDWTAELSGHLLVVAGRPYRPESARGEASGSAAAPGTVLQDETFAPGELGITFASPPPSDVETMRAYLRDSYGYADESDPSVVFDAVTGLLNEWTLSSREHAALLGVLSTLQDVESLGKVDDRLGRPGLAFSARSATSKSWESVLVISRELGTVIAVEKVYLGGVEGLNLTPPAVTSYVAWR